MDSMLENLKLKYHSFIMHDMTTISSKIAKDFAGKCSGEIRLDSDGKMYIPPNKLNDYSHKFNDLVISSITEFALMLGALIIECLEEAKNGR